MRKIHGFLILMLLSNSVISCNNEPENNPVETEPIEFKKEGDLYLVKAEGDTIQNMDIEIADNAYEWQTGLMYRNNLKINQGMLFIYNEAAPRSFFMKNTHIPLDILYFDADSTAVSFQENAIPLDETSLPSEAPAQFILEINAGLVKKWNIEVGDKIDFERLD